MEVKMEVEMNNELDDMNATDRFDTLDDTLASWANALEDGNFDHALACEDEQLTIGLDDRGFAVTSFRLALDLDRTRIRAEFPVAGAWQTKEESAAAEADALAAVNLARVIVDCLRDPKCVWLPNDPSARLDISADAESARWSLLNGEGEICDSGDGWESLLAVLDRVRAPAPGEMILPA